MDKNDYNNFFGFNPYNLNSSFDNSSSEFNPMAQYEQGYIYYRFLTQQIEYKIKCKELEKINNDSTRNERRIS